MKMFLANQNKRHPINAMIRTLFKPCIWIGIFSEKIASTPYMAITKTEKHVIPKPIKSRLGYHIILVCEDRDKVVIEKPKVAPTAAPAGTNIPT